MNVCLVEFVCFHSIDAGSVYGSISLNEFTLVSKFIHTFRRIFGFS